jgi:integrase
MLFKRKAIFYGRVKNEHGRWIARTLNTADRKVAEVRYRELERREADPSYRASHETTIATASRDFVTSRTVKGCAAGTMHMYRVKLGHIARLFGSDLPLAQVDAPRVDHFVAARLREGAKRNTIGKELTALRGLLKVAQRAGKFPRPLYEVLPSEWSNDYEPRRTALSPSQVQALVEVLPVRRAAMVAFIVATGARWSEAVAATRQMVDLGRGIVHFKITKTKKSGRREKHVPITPLTRPLLEQVIAATDRAGVLFAKWGNVNRDLKAACVALGLPRVTPNDLRRTHANWLRDAGVDTASIADVLGHVDSRMVERVYGKLRPEQLRDRVLASTGRETLV